MTSVVALAIVSACATAQTPTVDPTASGITTVYIVRHAEKSTMAPTNPDPDITSAGQRRAEALASRLGTAGVTAIIQPGGSIRDEMAIEAADRHHLSMVFTGRRHFRH